MESIKGEYQACPYLLNFFQAIQMAKNPQIFMAGADFLHEQSPLSDPPDKAYCQLTEDCLPCPLAIIETSKSLEALTGRKIEIECLQGLASMTPEELQKAYENCPIKNRFQNLFQPANSK